MKTITTLLLVLCISICNAQVSTFYNIDSCCKPQFKIEHTVPLSSQELDFVAHPLVGSYLSIDTASILKWHPNAIDSIVANPDGTIAFYYSNDIWKDRYYALKKMRDYGYFRIPIHNRHKFRKAEKEYRELMK